MVAEDVPCDVDPYRFVLRTPGASHVFSSPEKSAWIQLVQDVVVHKTHKKRMFFFFFFFFF